MRAPVRGERYPFEIRFVTAGGSALPRGLDERFASVGGFGDTAAQALRDLAGQMEFENHRFPGIDF